MKDSRNWEFIMRRNFERFRKTVTWESGALVDLEIQIKTTTRKKKGRQNKERGQPAKEMRG